VNVCNGFEASGEFQTLVATLYGTAASDNERTEHFVNNFYLGATGQGATSTQLQQQRDALNTAAAQGLSQVQTQAETFGRSLFVAQVNDAGLSNTQYVTNLYEAFLQRGPDDGGLGWWSGQASVGQGRQNVLNAFATCGAFRELAGTLYREANWLVADHLGTPRMIVNKSGSLASVKRHDYLPFGEELFAGTGGRTTTPQGYSGDSVRQKFTSYERDDETGLDYAHARYHASKQGRFSGVDRVGGSPADPQSWNGYSYTHNNPLNLTDPTGLYASAEYAYDPGRESDPYLWESRQRRVTTDDIERALAAYQQMVDNGLANLKLKQQQKDEAKLARESATVSDVPQCGSGGQVPATVVVEQKNVPGAATRDVNGTPILSIGVDVRFTFYDQNGQPITNAVVGEQVESLEGPDVDRTEDPVPLDADGRGGDLIANSVPLPQSRAELQAAEVTFNQPFTTKQRITLTVVTSTGITAQVTQVRTLTNTVPGAPTIQGRIGGYTFTMEKPTIRIIRR
jgi:RHS repeat-associated protein